MVYLFYELEHPPLDRELFLTVHWSIEKMVYLFEELVHPALDRELLLTVHWSIEKMVYLLGGAGESSAGWRAFSHGALEH